MSGNYLIDVDEQVGHLRPFYVECDMGDGQDIFSVKTIVHHDSEAPESVRGYEAPGSYLKNISYGDLALSQIETLIDISFSCQQWIKWDCKGAMFGFWYPRDIDNWWVGRGWQNQYYWGGAETDSKTCGCFPYCYPTVRNSTCNCDANLKLQWLEDSGLLLDSKRLPVLQLRFGDTGESYEAGLYTLGPLVCRGRGHKLVNMGSYVAPITFSSPGYPELYPPAFHRYKWHIVINEGQIIELVFPYYDVIHYGAYNSVPNCRTVIEVDIRNSSGGSIGNIKREKASPPYFISDGRETQVDLTLTTCNQFKNIENKGFVAEFRKSECGGCNAGFGQNGSFTQCKVNPNQCITISSFGYPFPHYIYHKAGNHYNHSWEISTFEGYIIQIEFNDFDIISTPGLHYCNADLLTVFDIQFNETIKTATYCNINKFNIGKLTSNSNQMLLNLKTTLKKVGNSRGFHATVRSLPKIINNKKWSNNIAEGKSTDQSSTKSGFEASLAVDGSTDGKPLSKCSATNYQREPWWRVNLQKRHKVYGIQIYSADISHQNEKLSWPNGQYGLPMPVSGCPSAFDTSWKTGLRFHDVRHEPVQDDKFRYWSQGIMLKGGSTDDGIVQHFCIRDSKLADKLLTNTTNYGWMPGKYCIFQVGDSCPDGFQSGAITWFDKSNSTPSSESKNYVKGTLPKGFYTPLNTTIYFCCREDGNPDISIKLPKDRPFYLLQYGDECQKVEGMSEIEHFFHYEEEIQLSGLSLELIFIIGTNQLKFQDPHPRVDIALFEKGLTLHYCYYDVSDQLKGFQVLVDTTPDTYGFSQHYDDVTGISRAVDKPFLSAVECASFDVTSTDLNVITLNCKQPIEGQYVIIFMNDRFDSLRLCEVKVFGEESCGRPLGMATEEILDLAISSSSIDDHGLNHYHVNARLNSPKAWCAAINDPEKYIQIDLLYGEGRHLHKDFDSKIPFPTSESSNNYVTIVGIAMQGIDNIFKSSFVTQFHLLFSNDTINWTFEEEPIGRQKVYKCVQCESQNIDGNEIVMYNLLKPILTRYVRVKILSFKIAPCLRLEVIGCRDQSKACVTTLTDTTGTISSPNYPFYYAQYKSCWWHISPGHKSGHKHVELDFIVLDLATRDKSGGKCHDSLSIYHPQQTLIEAGSRVSSSQSSSTKTQIRLYPKKIISNGAISLHLKTCFRYSISRFQGFYAKYKVSSCAGCGIGDSVCGKVHNCVSNCGRILSINYPLNYINNHRCQWLITAPQEYYVNVTVEDFDVPNTSIGSASTACIFDHISFTDVATGQLIGRYCNAKKPPKYILSNWNKLLIEFNTDSSLTGRGFSLTYVAHKFELQPKLAQHMISPKGACPQNWTFFRGYCYNAFFEKESLQWYQSEERCAQMEKGRDGHLVSITDQHEMHVVHYLLITKWKVTPHQSIYIGLIDTNREGFYNWSDGNPMSYTDWSYGSSDGDMVAAQPDGGAFEDCTVIKVESSHSTANWHDIPCSLGKRTSQQLNLINNTKIFSDVISGYICKMDSSSSSHQYKLRQPLFTNVITEDEEEFYRRVDDDRYFVCENLEVISNLFRCDGTPNCRDGSDETEGCPVSGNTCLDSQYRCANGRCVAVGMYCDFIDDCGDGSDEQLCERRQCKKNSEFKCNNDQCIPLSKRCDLLTNCKDYSDEGYACSSGGRCNLNSTFQCYYGNCIPLYALCDRHRDCPGKFHEDEQSSRCYKNNSRHSFEKRDTNPSKQNWHSKLISDQVERVWARNERSACILSKRRTCQDLQLYDSFITNGTYFIQPEGLSSIGMTVECHFLPERATTLIHHDSEAKLYVRSDTDGPATYSRTITYDQNLETIVALINSSKTCKQFISWQCSGSGFRFNSSKPVSWWVSRQGIPQMSWGGSRPGTCGCYPNCTQESLVCNCDSEVRFKWNEDSGYIWDKEKLPVIRVVFGETYKIGQSGYFFVGPLECDGNLDENEDSNACRVQPGDKPDFKCQSGQIIEAKNICIYEFDQLGYQIGCRDVSHLRDCDTYQCPADYVKCPDSYCIPPRYICNGKWDCVGGSDEIGCARYMCPGQYKCANESSCVLLHQLCDDIRHCPLGDDEWFCDLTCPKNCTCIGLYVNCKNVNLSRLPIESIPKDTRKLELSGNSLGPSLLSADFSFFSDLGELILQTNGIEIIKSRKFLQLTNLYKLDLRFNNIQVLESAAFAGLKKVTNLLLGDNPNLTDIEPRAFVGLTSLRHLNISFTNVKVLQENVFLQMSSLQTLVFRQNGLQVIEKGAFNELTSLVSLDLRDNDIKVFAKDMFNVLKSLRFLSSDSFKFCCLASNIVPFERCVPSQDEISDCEDLMSNAVQRSFLWVLGIVALLGNFSVIIWRCRTRLFFNPVSSTLILSLGCADFLMGIYLIIIASIDVHYRGRYIENADLWQNSILCKFCGFLSTISSEVSVVTLVFITVDRLLCISYPLSMKKITLSLTYRLIALSWSTVFVIAALPLFPISYFNEQFYSRSGTCLALHITTHKPAGWEYSVAIFLCFNLMAFIVIVVCYSFMYKTIRLSARKMRGIKARQVRETQVGRQMALIVVTNFLCWFPVIVMGLMAIAGFTIPGAAYSWIAVFVIPLNSATNPIVYTLAQIRPSLLSFKAKRDSFTSRALISTFRQQGKSIDRTASNTTDKTIKAIPGYQPLIEFLRDKQDLNAKHLLEISYSISEQIKAIHEKGRAFGGINFDSVYVSDKINPLRLTAFVFDYNDYPVINDCEADDYGLDMEEFGLLVKRMLQLYHLKINFSSNNSAKSAEEENDQQIEDNEEDPEEDSEEEREEN